VREDAAWRVQRLIQHNSRSARQDADEVTDRLLVRCAAAGYSGEPVVITQEAAARMAGIDVADLEGTGNWGSELAARYRLGLPAAGGVAEPDALAVAVHVRRAVVGGLHSALRRSVEAVTGQPLSAAGARQLLASPMNVGRGELVRVDLYLSLPAPRHFVVVDDPVPGGLEPVNRDLATGSTVDADATEFQAAGGSLWFKYSDWSEYGIDLWSFYHRELLHEAARFYADYLPAGHYHLSYGAQAMAEGQFSASPTKAEEMYDPDVYGKGFPAQVIVGHE